jgi:cytochrome c
MKTFSGLLLAMVLLLPVVVRAGDALPPGNADRGMRLYLQCVACHDLKPGGVPKVGPHLGGLFGRKAGTVQGLVISPALQSSGVVWDAKTLDQWLAKPTSLIPGIIMVIPGIEKPQDRADIIAYLQRDTVVQGKAP